MSSNQTQIQHFLGQVAYTERATYVDLKTCVRPSTMHANIDTKTQIHNYFDINQLFIQNMVRQNKSKL